MIDPTQRPPASTPTAATTANLVRPSSRTLHSYPSGAVIFPMRLCTESVLFIDCMENHFTNLPGTLVGSDQETLTTDEVVGLLRGTCDAVWFENIIDPAHAAMVTSADVVFAYDPRHLAFAITGDSPAVLSCESWVKDLERPVSKILVET